MDYDQFRIYSEALSNEFWRRLQAKTGWGRNDILREFEASQKCATLAVLSAGVTKVEDPSSIRSSESDHSTLR